MNTSKNLTTNQPRETIASKDVLPDLFLDVIDPSPRHSARIAEEYPRAAIAARSCTALSELRAPKSSHRVGFSEFLD